MITDYNKSSTFTSKSKFRVPFGTVSVTTKAKELVDEAFASNWLTRGRYVEEFEERFADLFGTKYAVAVSSGTDADAIACAVLYDYGAQRGDEVIVPALTFVASANSIFQAGFKPVFVDVCRDTLNIDPQAIEAVITPRTKAIMAVHLMGKPAEMNAIQAIAKKHDLIVIEDAAEAHGARYRGQRVGSLGDMAAYSLYAAHIVTTIEGGIITTNDEKMAEAMRSLRNHGILNKFQFQRIGFSAKMNEIEAAVGLGNIEIYDDIFGKRRRNLNALMNGFKSFQKSLLCLTEAEHEVIGPHAFSIIVREDQPFTKDEFVEHIEAKGIDSRNLFYSIPTQCASYRPLGHKLGDFPESEYCSNHGTHIGVHQDLDLDQINYVIDTVGEFLKSKGL